MEENIMEQSHKKQLEDKVRKMINETYGDIYIAPLIIKYEDGVWTLKVGVNGREVSQLSLGFQGTEDNFLEFLCKEIQKKKFNLVVSNKVTLINGDAPMHHPVIEL